MFIRYLTTVCKNIQKKKCIALGYGLLFVSGITTAQSIQRIEKQLIPAVTIKGATTPTTSIEVEMKRQQIPGVSIAFVDNGKITWTKCYGYADKNKKIPVTPQTLFSAASISKPLTALATLKLVEQGYLNLDEDVNVKLKSWKVPDTSFTQQEKVTLRRLLGHTAGVANQVFKNYAQTEALPTTVQLLKGELPSKNTAVVMESVPGKKPAYANSGYLIIEMLLMDVSGKSFAQLLHELVLRPAAMSQSTFQQPLPQKYEHFAAKGYWNDDKEVEHTVTPFLAPAGLWTNPSDLARLMIAVQQSYAGVSTKILSEKMMHQMLDRSENSLGFFKYTNKNDLLFYHKGHNDGFSCIFAGLANKQQGVIIMTNGNNGDGLVDQILRAVANEYKWEYAQTEEHTPVALDSSLLNKYVGNYEMVLDKMTITQKGGKLYMQSAAMGNQVQELLADSNTKFFILPVPIRLEFQTDNNQVTGLKVIAFGNEYMAKKL